MWTNLQTFALQKVGMMKTLEMNERKKNVTFTFSLRDTDGKNTLFAKDSVNCDCRDGKLRTALGGAKLLKADGFPQTCDLEGVTQLIVLKVYDSATKTYTERFGALTESGEFHVQEKADGEFIRIATGMENAGVEQFAGETFRYKLALIGENTCVYFKDDDTFDIAMLEGTSKTGCFFKHRMFVGMRPSKLVCSAPEDELDFTESIHDGGLIRFPCVGGSIVAMKAFDDRLYVFFEYGILKMNASGATKNFTADELQYAGGKIYGRTVCVGNHGLYFMTSDGVYRFDGEEVDRLFPDLVELPKSETLLESGVTFSERVLIRYLTKTGYRTLVFYEDGKDCYYMDKLPIFSGEEGGRCLFTDENGVICQLRENGEVGFEGRFFGAETDLGVAGRKTLTKLCFEGEGSFSLTVKTGGRSFTREVAFASGVTEVKLSERGERFAFDLLLQNGTTISKMTAEFKTVA